MTKTMFALLLTAAVACTSTASRAAEPYPTRSITILNGFSAGGAVDTVARALAEQLSKDLGQSVMVESRPGAGSNIAATAAARSPADGHTLLLGTNGLAINMALYDSPGYDVEKDLAPITMVGEIPAVIAANPAFPATTLDELVGLAKQKPGEIAYGTPGHGSLPHLAMALLGQQAGIDLKHVPYRGGHPAVTDALGGHVQLVVVNALEATPYVQARQLKGLGVTGDKRLAALPDTPIVAEDKRFPGYEARTWWALFAPAGTPKAVIDTLKAATHKALANPDLRKRIEGVGGTVLTSSPEELAAFVKAERGKWGAVVKQTGLKGN